MDKKQKKNTNKKDTQEKKTVINKKKTEPDETEINNVLMSIGKKTRNPSAKQLVNGFVGKLKSKTEDEDSVQSKKSSKKCILEHYALGAGWHSFFVQK